jgi:excisionase family DNA binding protein
MATDETGLPIAVAAETLGIHPRTLRRYIGDGRIHAVRYTTQVVRILQSEIDAFLEHNIRIDTGTGTCYVPRPAEEKPAKAKKAAQARPRVGRFG